MISWVFDHCHKTTDLEGHPTLNFDVYVVTDDDRIESHLKEAGKNVVRVDDDVPSGTERIELAYSRFFSEKSYDFVVNVQGDEPLFTGDDLATLVDFHQKTNFDIATLINERNKREENGDFNNPNVVKAVWSEGSGECHYLSRSAVPHARDAKVKNWHSHIGVYSYKPEVLKAFCSYEQSYLEKTECLEQLRAIENGHSIGALRTSKKFVGVDTPEDIEKLKDIIGGV